MVFPFPIGLQLFACEDTTDLKPVPGDINATLKKASVKIYEDGEIQLDYQSDDQNFPFTIGEDNELTIPSGAGWNLIDIYTDDEISLSLNNRIPVEAEEQELEIVDTSDTALPVSSYNLETTPFVATIGRANCNQDVGLTLFTGTVEGERHTCETSALSDDGTLTWSALIESAEELLDTEQCSAARLIASRDNIDICVTFSLQAPGLYQWAETSL